MNLKIILLFILLAGVSVTAQSDSQMENVAAEITKVMNGQSEAWNRGDIDGFMAGYWRSDKLIFLSGENVTRGWQPTLDRYKKSYDTREKMGTLKFSDLEFTILSKESAVVLGSWELTRQKDNPKGKFTLTFRKLKEGWRIVMDHTS